jgi:tetratricopeptide (TPR) repeat protein
MNDHSPARAHGTDPYLKRLRRRKLLVGVGISLIAIIGIIALVVGVGSIARTNKDPRIPKRTVMEQWNGKDYQAVSASCDTSLEASPLDPFYLTFKGLASFYLGMAESDGEKRIALMDQTIFALRKALLDAKAPLRPEATYILGKAYFHKGLDFYDESITTLLESIKLKYSAADTWEYLALASQGIGEYKQSAGYFDQAMAAKPDSPELMIAAASVASQTGDSARAETLALKALSATTDEYLAERCNFVLGDIYRSSGRLTEALARYDAIKEKNPESADAWYYEGLVFQSAGDPIKARAAWRKAVSIDPMHTGARQKLSERS